MFSIKIINCFQLITSTDAMPMVWTLSNGINRGDSKVRFLNTKSFNKRPNNKRNYTLPIKVKSEVRNDCMKQTGQYSHLCIIIFDIYYLN